MKPTVIICPGNGCTNIKQSNWYGILYENLVLEHNIKCICENFPDPLHARRDRWVPFIRKLIIENQNANNNNNVILIGHSSGAQAALRYAEQYQLKGCILVSATYSDLGDSHERASGYYPQKKTKTKTGGGGGGGGGDENNEVEEETINPYLFDKMKQNCLNFIQFHSDNDPFIPLYEAEKIRDGLGLTNTYHMLPGRSHFFDYSEELLESVLSLC